MRANSGKNSKFLLLLAFATPGIPEYLTGSWKLSILFSTPIHFLAFLALNIGMYTTGAILIREFAVTFRKGWVTVFILGCAYGIMEEAIALHTFFQVSGSPVGFLGSYGRFAGVDWVWAFGLTVFHAVFSISLPILLLSTAYPEKSGKRITATSGSVFALIIYGLSIFILNFITNHTSSRPIPTYIEYMFFILISAVLVVISYYIPRDILYFRGKEDITPLVLYFLGFIVYPVYNIFAFIPVNPAIVTRISPFSDLLIHTIAFAGILAAVIHFMPRLENRKHKLALAAGLITPLILSALRMELNRTAPMIVIVVIIAVIFLLKLFFNIQRDEVKFNESALS